jgi:hypothetical protein
MVRYTRGNRYKKSRYKKTRGKKVRGKKARGKKTKKPLTPKSAATKIQRKVRETQKKNINKAMTYFDLADMDDIDPACDSEGFMIVPDTVINQDIKECNNPRLKSMMKSVAKELKIGIYILCKDHSEITEFVDNLKDTPFISKDSGNLLWKEDPRNYEIVLLITCNGHKDAMDYNKLFYNSHNSKAVGFNNKIHVTDDKLYIWDRGTASNYSCLMSNLTPDIRELGEVKVQGSKKAFTIDDYISMMIPSESQNSGEIENLGFKVCNNDSGNCCKKKEDEYWKNVYLKELENNTNPNILSKKRKSAYFDKTTLTKLIKNIHQFKGSLSELNKIVSIKTSDGLKFKNRDANNLYGVCNNRYLSGKQIKRSKD